MTGIRAYILSVCAAAIICSIVTGLMRGKTTAAQLVKLCGGIFLALIVIRPLTDIDLTFFSDLTFGYISDAEEVSTAGKNLASDALADIIKVRCEAYILDKAQSLGAELTVEVTVSQDDMPVPLGATMRGSISPYARSQLASVISDQLGIPKEDQQWIG